jgi:hypothetical protein
VGHIHGELGLHRDVVLQRNVRHLRPGGLAASL